MQDHGTDLQHTHRPGAPGVHPGALEVLVYLRQHCTVFHLPESGLVRVGRSPTNDLRIDDPSVSRFHFALHIGDTIEEARSSRQVRELVVIEPLHERLLGARVGVERGVQPADRG